jgi:hypothetical protein
MSGSLRLFTPLLATESIQEYEACRSELIHLDPRDPIERLYCEDFVRRHWDTLRWHDAKAATANLALRDALYEVLVERLGEFPPGQETAGHLAKWFAEAGIRKEISDVLARYNLDESVIEAEAYRRCAPDLMKFDYLLISAESRRDKALHHLTAYRDGLGQKLGRKTIDMTEDKNILEKSVVARLK